MIGTYKLINGIAVLTHKVGSNDNSEMVSQFSLSFPTYSVKRSDVTGNRFEWELGENKVT